MPASHKTYLLILLSYGILLLVLSVDLILLMDRPLLAEGAPTFVPIYAVRSGLLITFSLLSVLAFGAFRPQGPKALRSAGEGQWISNGESPEKERLASQWIVWIAIFLSAIFVIAFLLEPRLFYELGLEDRIIEFCSASFYFLAGMTFLRVFLVFKKRQDPQRWLFRSLALIFALGLIVLGLEEISWFQRIFLLNTPDFLEGNPRGEINLHNFATDLFENVFYFGSFLFLILIPYLYWKAEQLGKRLAIRRFVPGRAPMYVCALALAYNYDMWNVLFTQVSFFITLLLLLDVAWVGYQKFAKDRRRKPPETDPKLGSGYLFANIQTLTPAIVLVVYTATQALFLIYGGRSIRLWDVTEYKEFFIPLALLVYALETLAVARAQYHLSEAGAEMSDIDRIPA